MSTGYDLDSYSAPATGDAWKPEIGDTIKGTVTYVGDIIKVSTFSGKEERTLRVDLDTADGTRTIWATLCTDTDIDPQTNAPKGYPKRDARAIAAAVRSAGETAIKVGGTLGMKRIDDVPTKAGNAKAFQAQYKPPATPPADTPAGDDGAVDDLI